MEGVSGAGLVVAAAALLLGSAGAARAAPAGVEAVSCATHGLAASAAPGGLRAEVRVVTLEASGLACTAARTIAHQVAEDLVRHAALSFPRASSFAISEVSCTGCLDKTEVAISYPAGKVTLSLARSGPAGAPSTPGGVVTA